jgi:PAS domain S-box-containing protein
MDGARTALRDRLRGMPTDPPMDPPIERLDPFASPSRIRELVEQLPVAVYVDNDDRPHACVYASPNIEKILGYPAERIIAEPDLWTRLIHPDDLDRVSQTTERSWTDGTPFRGEYRMVRPDGEVIWVRDSCMLVLSDDGNRLAWQGVIEDITREKRAAQDVKDSDARYRALVERIPAVVYEMGPDDERRTLYVSPHVESVLGYTREEWLDQPDIWIELLHADDREVVLDRHDRHSRTGEPWDLEYRLIANDGRVVWVHDRGTLIRSAEGRPPAWHGVMIDVTAEHDAKEMLLITNEDLERRVAQRTGELAEANELMSLEIGERRRMEGELRDARQRYQRLVENLPGVAYLWEASPGAGTRSFTYISPQIEEMLGFAPGAWEAELRVHPHDQARVAEAVTRSSGTGEPLRIEYRYLAGDGRIVWVLDHASLISRTTQGEPRVFQGVMLDITGLKEAESKAAQAEDRFRAITERGPVVAHAYELRYDGNDWPPTVEPTYVSPRVAEIVGYPLERSPTDLDSWLDIVHPDDRERASATIHQGWGTGQDWTMRYRVIRSDGRVIWLQSMGRMLERDALGRPWRFLGVLFEITEEQEALLRLEREEANQRAALEGVRAIPWIETINPDTGFERYTYIGPHVAEILGYTAEELMVERRHFPRMVHPDDRARIRGSLSLAAETGRWEDEYRVFARDGGIRWLRSFGRRVSAHGEAPEVWRGIAIDVTESRATDDGEGARSPGERSEHPA